MPEEVIINIIMYAIVFIFGIVIGSFLNVCIYRIPKKESIVTVRSHCMSCGYQLKWYDLVPLFSYIFLKGRCRSCGEKISPQYPVVEGINGVLYCIIFAIHGLSIQTLLFCLLFSALLALSIIDLRTFTIPPGFNWFILGLGVVGTAFDLENWLLHIIGLACVSLFLYLLYIISKGKAIGGGDIKLMAAAGLLLGWKLIILSFVLGCILGSVIHLIRMKCFGAERRMALGPYLSLGIAISVLFGNQMIGWYLGMMGI